MEPNYTPNAPSTAPSFAFVVLPHEDQSEFDRLLQTYRADFTPKTCHEQFLVDQMAQSRWRLDRTRRFESIALEQLLTGEFDKTNPNARIVAKLAEKCPDIVTFLHRYASAAEKSYHRAHRELTQARSREKRNKANDAQAWMQQQLQAIKSRPYDDPTRAVPVSWAPPPAHPAPSTQNRPDEPDNSGFPQRL